MIESIRLGESLDISNIWYRHVMFLTSHRVFLTVLKDHLRMVNFTGLLELLPSREDGSGGLSASLGLTGDSVCVAASLALKTMSSWMKQAPLGK